MAEVEAEEVVFVDGMDVAVLHLGVEFTYRVPSFSAIEVNLRQAMIQIELPNGAAKLYDGFLQSHPSLPDSSRPSASLLYITITKHCFVPVDEFCKEVYVRHLRAVEDFGLLVVMEWNLQTSSEIESEDDPHASADRSDNTGLEGSDDEYSEDPIEDPPEDQNLCQSCVDFKCIGVTRDPTYQSILLEVRDMMESGNTVPIKLCPDPDNLFDSNAIAFQCLLNSIWKTFGYVVSEICGEVLDTIESGNIISVEFTWVKYKLWKKSPGFYAAVRITRKGEWSRRVKHSRSTFS